MELARLYERMGSAPAALSQIELALADPELHQRGDMASTAVRLAIESAIWPAWRAAWTPYQRRMTLTWQGHLRLLELRAMAGPASRSVGCAELRSIGRLRLADWQSAYDVARTLRGGTMAEAARLLFVALRLQNDGAPQAALNLLVRLHDAQPELPQVHALLTSVLADLGRYDDALASNEILRKLPGCSMIATLTPPAGYYDHPRPEVVAMIPTDAVRILELGCAGGSLGGGAQTTPSSAISAASSTWRRRLNWPRRASTG